MVSTRHEKAARRRPQKRTIDVGSVQADRMDEQVADNREQQRDQRPGDGDAGVQRPLEDLVDPSLATWLVNASRISWMSPLTVASSLFWSWTIVFRPLLRMPLMSATSVCGARMAAVCSSGVMAGFRSIGARSGAVEAG